MRDKVHEVKGSEETGEFPFLPEDSEADLWRKLHEVAGRRYGITSCLYCFSHSRFSLTHLDVMRAAVLFHSHPDVYFSSFEPQSFFSDDITCSRLISGEDHCLWTEAAAWPHATPAQRRKEAFYRDIGMGVGVSLGFRFFNDTGIVGMGMAAANSTAEEFAAVWREHGAEIARMVRAFDAHMRPRVIANRFQLTPREREVLALFAGGLSAKEISHELRIKIKTVFNTMERARKAMKAANTMEAVAKAMAFGLL